MRKKEKENLSRRIARDNTCKSNIEIKITQDFLVSII